MPRSVHTEASGSYGKQAGTRNHVENHRIGRLVKLLTQYVGNVLAKVHPNKHEKRQNLSALITNASFGSGESPHASEEAYHNSRPTSIVKYKGTMSTGNKATEVHTTKFSKLTTLREKKGSVDVSALVAQQKVSNRLLFWRYA